MSDKLPVVEINGRKVRFRRSTNPEDPRPILVDRSLTNAELWELTHLEVFVDGTTFRQHILLSDELLWRFMTLLSAKDKRFTVNGQSMIAHHDELFNPDETVEVVERKLLPDPLREVPRPHGKTLKAPPAPDGF